MRHVLPLFVALAIVGPPLQADAQTDLPLAKIVSVGGEERTITRRFYGQVAARETVDLAFQVGGQIIDFPVVEGDTIERGALVAELDLEPFELAVEQASAQQEQADRNLSRLERLRSSAISEVAISDTRTIADLAAITTRNSVRALEQATLTAPFDAQVAVRLVANYTTISPGTPVVRLHDMSELHIEIEVPEVLLQSTNEDPTTRIWAEFPGREGEFPLVVEEFDAQTSDVGQTIGITLAMSNPTGESILPGSSATVFARINVPDRGQRIPLGALVTGNDGQAQVMVYEASDDTQGTVRLAPVEIEPSENGEVLVISGLDVGQEIVASGAAYLDDGQAVRRFVGFPN